MSKITTTSNFDFIQDSFIEAKKASKIERETGVLNPNRLMGIGLEGASRCFAKGTKVETSSGLKPIEEIKPNDKVKSYNFDLKRIEYRNVEQLHHFPKSQKPRIRVNLKNGKFITATEDHEFWYKGAWVKLKDLVSLFNGLEKNT